MQPGSPYGDRSVPVIPTPLSWGVIPGVPLGTLSVTANGGQMSPPAPIQCRS
jgi:hypothetical protein